MDIIYCTTNDYMMRNFAADSPEALKHMKKIDDWLGKIYDLDHDREMYITGGYGINSKSHLINLQAILDEKGFDVVSQSPYSESEDGQEIKQQSGMRFLYLNENQKIKEEELVAFLEEQPYVDMVSPKEEASKRFNLPIDLIGDYLVFAADGYTFAEFDGVELELEEARSNGSLYERAIPLIAVNAGEAAEKYRYSRDIVKVIMEPPAV